MAGNLAQLRELLVNKQHCSSKLDAYIIASGDAHQSEYVCACDGQRAFITGFTGTAGTAVVTAGEALLWTDGRYHLQAANQMDDNWTLMKDGLPDTPSIGKWLNKSLPRGSLVGIDPWVFSAEKWKGLEKEVKTKGHKLVPVMENLVNVVWGKKRPERVNHQVSHLPIKFSGETWLCKVKRLRETMKEKDADLIILTALDDIAWLYNLRGSDILYNPVFFSFAAVTQTEAFLFIDESKLSSLDRACLEEDGQKIILRPYINLLSYIRKWLQSNSGVVWSNKNSSFAVHSIIPEDRLFDEASPVQLMKAIKNQTEIDGLKNSHIRDAAAVCRYLHFLEVTVNKVAITEISGSDRLELYRREQEDFVGLSFTTISAVGAHGANCHYKSSVETNTEITTEDIYLCDSGAQFLDGTTDITRTIHLGQPSQYERECFTRVLKGHIGLATAVFPQKIKGNAVDSFARQHLWNVGLDYMHGTGHGIGSYLNVHEGPMGIGKRLYPDDPGLQSGMFLSNEPGYYEDGKFGVRIESIVVIKEVETDYMFQNKKSLGFETVTVVPIQKKMILAELLTPEEVKWLNDYHHLCRELVGPLLKQQDEKVHEWLIRETEPLVV